MQFVLDLPSSLKKATSWAFLCVNIDVNDKLIYEAGHIVCFLAPASVKHVASHEFFIPGLA